MAITINDIVEKYGVFIPNLEAFEFDLKELEEESYNDGWNEGLASEDKEDNYDCGYSDGYNQGYNDGYRDRNDENGFDPQY